MFLLSDMGRAQIVSAAAAGLIPAVRGTPWGGGGGGGSAGDVTGPPGVVTWPYVDTKQSQFMRQPQKGPQTAEFTDKWLTKSGNKWVTLGDVTDTYIIIQQHSISYVRAFVIRNDNARTMRWTNPSERPLLGVGWLSFATS